MAQLNSLSIGGNAVTDFAIEQGKKGDWSYRIWNSGIAECWGNFTKSIKCSSNPDGTTIGFTGDGEVPVITLPADFFTDMPQIFVKQTDPLCWIGAVTGSTADINIRVFRTTKFTSSFTVTFSVYAIGQYQDIQTST